MYNKNPSHSLLSIEKTKNGGGNCHHSFIIPASLSFWSKPLEKPPDKNGGGVWCFLAPYLSQLWSLRVQRSIDRVWTTKNASQDHLVCVWSKPPSPMSDEIDQPDELLGPLYQYKCYYGYKNQQINQHSLIRTTIPPINYSIYLIRTIFLQAKHEQLLKSWPKNSLTYQKSIFLSNKYIITCLWIGLNSKRRRRLADDPLIITLTWRQICYNLSFQKMIYSRKK